MIRSALAFVAALPVCSAAVAADTPLFAPNKDVVVVYAASGASEQQSAPKLRVSYGSENRVRMDFFRFAETDTPFAWLIYDPTIDRITTVLPERHGYVMRDVGKLPSPGSFLRPDMKYSRGGTETVAGLGCTDWQVAGAGEATLCITDDGVVLRATREKPAPGELKATSVQYGPVAADVFKPPADFAFIPSADFPNIKPPGQ